MTVAKLTNDGTLQINGELDTRSPLIPTSLNSHFPLDGTAKGKSNNNLLDYSTWVPSTVGTQPGFTANGDGNAIIESDGPFGEDQAIWRALGNDTTSDADGGWNGNNIPIDSTKLYRFSVWIRRPINGNGTFYLGTHGYIGADGSGGNNNITKQTTTTFSSNTNPYFDTRSANSALFGDWALVVGFVHPHDDTTYTDHIDSGWYKPFKTGKVASLSYGDFRWQSTTTHTNHRSYLYYSTIPATEQQWAYPRVDLCDGTEPTIEDLVNGEGNVINTELTSSKVVKNSEYLSLNTDTTNLIPNFPVITSGYNITRTVSKVENPWRYKNKVEMWKVDATSLAYNGWKFDIINGLEYTATALIFDPENVLDSYTLHDNTTNFANISSYSFDVGGGWKKIVSIGTATATKNTSHGFIIYLSSVIDAHLWISDPQIEQKNFPTEYIDGYAPAGYINFNSNIVTPDKGSFYFEAFISPSFYSDTTYTDMLDFKAPTAGNRFIIFRKDAGSILPNRMFLRTGSVFTTASVDQLINQNKWNSFMFTWDINSGYSMYVNGNVVKTENTYLLNDRDYELYNFKAGWNVKNISVYNERLNDNDALKLAKGTHIITKNGLLTKGINTVHSSQGTHFPFDFNTADIYNETEATTNLNTLFDDGSVFISSGSTNYTSDINISGISGITLTNIGVEKGWTKYAISGTWNNGTYPYSITISSVSFTGGSAYSASLDIKTNVEHKFNNIGNGLFYVNEPKDIEGVGRFTEHLGIKTISYSNFVYTATTSQSGYINSNPIADGTVFDATTDFIWVRNVQVQSGVAVSPSFEGTLNSTDLFLPYNIIDCKNDFTISGWMKPSVFADIVTQYRPFLVRNIPNGNVNNRRILIMQNSTTSTTLGVWLSSGGNAQTVLTLDGSEILKDEWNFFCLRRIGANIHLSLGNSNGFLSTSAALAYQLDIDETGQVWQVGEYNNQESDAYHRDYSFIQKGLNDTEVEAMFSTKMKADINSLKILNSIETGKEL